QPRPDAVMAKRQVAAETCIDAEPGTHFWRWTFPGGLTEGRLCPYGRPHDLLWVRETFMVDHVEHATGPLPKHRPDADIYYRADGECCDQIPECQCADASGGW